MFGFLDTNGEPIDFHAPPPVAQPTPGPWRAVPNRYINKEGGLSGYTHICAEHLWPEIATVHGTTGHREAPEQAANARLIAAAPDMLEALRDCLPLFSEVACGEVEDRVRAAIAKATGAA